MAQRSFSETDFASQLLFGDSALYASQRGTGENSEFVTRMLTNPAVLQPKRINQDPFDQRVCDYNPRQYQQQRQVSQNPWDTSFSERQCPTRDEERYNLAKFESQTPQRYVDQRKLVTQETQLWNKQHPKDTLGDLNSFRGQIMPLFSDQDTGEFLVDNITKPNDYCGEKIRGLSDFYRDDPYLRGQNQRNTFDVGSLSQNSRAPDPTKKYCKRDFKSNLEATLGPM